ncbi:hypothetical protein GCM10007933_03710 [Zoogloea oryzae]|uniref:Uncharacterized protein n=1 Tax=Zoogloea oryzae TaxID=310767 RepID=A0ABQ6F6R5_9RHOO|nr:hypothetical protein [Zoogloea oryzae]GLT20919.1 hypothetical protein GCM10007933_03710 [Zoogloea oryzae]
MSARVEVRPSAASVFDGETDACQQLLGLFGAKQMRSIVSSCLRLGQLDFDSLARLQASDPEAFSGEYGAADDLLAWAHKVKDLADQIFIRVAFAKADWD